MKFRQRRSAARTIPARRRLAAAAFLCAIAVVAACQAGAEPGWTFLRAKKGEAPLRLTVSGSERTYYLLDAQNPLDFAADGPGHVKIITRPLSPDPSTPRVSYTIRVTRGAGEDVVFLKQISAEKDEAARAEGSGAVCEGEENILPVPRGRWDFRLYLLEGPGQVAVRLMQEENAPALVSCIPDAFERVIMLVQPSGNEYPHYRFTSERPLVFRVRGPAAISIRSRLDFEPGNIATAPFGLECVARPSGGGEGLREVAHFWTTRLEKSHYRDCPNIIPGELTAFDLDIPAGEWVCEVRPTDVPVAGVSARVLMPKAALMGAEGS